jgi:S-methyl-5-thioribose-1-phosphate isomerase
MNISGTPYTSLWHEPLSDRIFYIDQTRLPWELVIREMKSFEDGVRAIKDMEVRGAPLIGVAAGFAMYLGHKGTGAQGHKGTGAQGHRGGAQGHRGAGAEGHKGMEEMGEVLMATRPTAVNLRKAVEFMTDDARPQTDDRRPPSENWPNEFPHYTSPHLNQTSPHLNHPSPHLNQTSPHLNHPSPHLNHPSPHLNQTSLYLTRALALREAEIMRSRAIGEHGLRLIEEVAERKGGAVVNILTHCNAGWLAAIDYGTALAPVYMAHDKGIKVHVWVDETRPRNQGSKLTAYELSQHGVPCTVIVDNAGGHLMQRGEVDMCIVGADRITRNGDATNKIGTYLKALAAYDNHIPFYVAAPTSTFDETMETGEEIPIEERGAEEVIGAQGHGGTRAWGHGGMGSVGDVGVGVGVGVGVPVGATCGRPSTPVHTPSPVYPFPGVPDGVAVRNPGFDVTPARLITAFITEEGVRTPGEMTTTITEQGL